jgi:Na+/melibiose symporter-like transporter
VRVTARIVEAIAPTRLGRKFRWLLAASIANGIGDGVVVSAGPLLVASLTHDPFLVSLALLSEYLPVLLFGVIGGVAADRFDRRRMVVIVNLGRTFVLTALVVVIASGAASIALVLVALFALGTGETFADSATSTLLPGLVAREDLGIGNARIQGAQLLTNQLLLPPVGAFLFAIGPAIPFATNAIGFALGAVLISRLATDVRRSRPDRTGVRSEMAQGLRWLFAHPPMRTLALTIFTFNITFGAAWSVLVLYAGQRLGMNAVGFGLLTTAVALGGVIGTVSYGRLERRFKLSDIMRVGLIIETVTHLVLALTTSAAIAPRSSGSRSAKRSRNASFRETLSLVSGIRPPSHNQSFDSSRSRSAIPRTRASAMPRVSASASSIGISTASSGRSSSATENLANGNSSFQRSSRRYDLRNMSLMGGA